MTTKPTFQHNIRLNEADEVKLKILAEIGVGLIEIVRKGLYTELEIHKDKIETYQIEIIRKGLDKES